MPLKPREEPGKPKLSVPAWTHKLHAHHLLYAVLKVFREHKRTEKLTGARAGEASWTTLDELRLDLWKQVRTAWIGCAKVDFTSFPYSVDFVSSVYRQLSEMSVPERNQLGRDLQKLYPED